MKPTLAASLALIVAVAAAHAAPPATKPTTQPENSAAGFGVGWAGTLKYAVVRNAVYQDMPDSCLVEVMTEARQRIGSVLLTDAPFKSKIADRTAVPAEYATLKIKVTGQFTNRGRTVFVADFLK